jgi:transposase
VPGGRWAAVAPLAGGVQRAALAGEDGAHWRMMPNDLPPWPVVYQQTRRWIRAGCFEVMVEDLGSLLREFAGRKSRPTAMVVDSRTLQSTPESGARGGYDGAKRRKGSKVHAAVSVRATQHSVARWASGVRRHTCPDLEHLVVRRRAEEATCDK